MAGPSRPASPKRSGATSSPFGRICPIHAKMYLSTRTVLNEETGAGGPHHADVTEATRNWRLPADCCQFTIKYSRLAIKYHPQFYDGTS